MFLGPNWCFYKFYRKRLKGLRLERIIHHISTHFNLQSHAHSYSHSTQISFLSFAKTNGKFSFLQLLNKYLTTLANSIRSIVMFSSTHTLHMTWNSKSLLDKIMLFTFFSSTASFFMQYKQYRWHIIYNNVYTIFATIFQVHAKISKYNFLSCVCVFVWMYECDMYVIIIIIMRG